MFLDPPYIEEHNYNFQYSPGEEYTNDLLQELKVEVTKTRQKGVKWLSFTPVVKELFKEYTIVEFPVFRLYNRPQKVL